MHSPVQWALLDRAQKSTGQKGHPYPSGWKRSPAELRKDFSYGHCKNQLRQRDAPCAFSPRHPTVAPCLAIEKCRYWSDDVKCDVMVKRHHTLEEKEEKDGFLHRRLWVPWGKRRAFRLPQATGWLGAHTPQGGGHPAPCGFPAPGSHPLHPSRWPQSPRTAGLQRHLGGNEATCTSSLSHVRRWGM